MFNQQLIKAELADKRTMAESIDEKHGTSDEFVDPYCDVCYGVKKLFIRSEAYCNNCYQCLCKDCLSVHRMLLGTSDHVIRTGEDMPKSQEDKPPRFETCDIHHRYRKDHYCSDHRLLICTLCVLLHHKYCPVENVECAAKSIPSSEINSLYCTVSDFRTQLLSAESHVESNISDLRDQRKKILKQVQEMYDKTVSKINQLFHRIQSDLESKYQFQSSALTCEQKNIKSVTVNLESTLDDINVLKGRLIDIKVFLKIQDILKNIDKYKMDVSTLNQTTSRKMLNFIPDKMMNNVLTSSFTMGTISLDDHRDVTISVPEIMFPSSSAKLSQASVAEYQPFGNTNLILDIKAQIHAEYNIKLRGDTSWYCWITGLSITMDGRQLLADCRNSKIKMFSRDMKIISSLPLPAQPWDIAVTGDREAVVSVDDQSKLFILDVSDKQMSIKRTVKLSFKVHGIVIYKDKLVVTSLYPSLASVKLINLSGKVYWSTSTNQEGQRLFALPLYVSCYDDGRLSTVIVTDCNSHTLTLLDSDRGDVISRLQVKGKGPGGVTTDSSGNIFVCSWSTSEVSVLSRDFSKEKILLTERDGIRERPQAIVYDAEYHRLLVSYFGAGEFAGYSAVDCFHLL